MNSPLLKPFLSLILLLGLASAGLAQSADADTLTSHEQAAVDVLALLDVQRTLDLTLDEMLNAMKQQNPMMAEYEDTFRSFFEKYLTWENLKSDYITLYTDLYTEEELEQLETFYASPLGQKVVEAMPELTIRSSLIGQEAVQKHSAELEQMMMERMSESEDQ